MGVYIKGLTLEQVQTLFDMVGGEPLGEEMRYYLTEVKAPHGRLIDADRAVKDYHEYGISHSYDANDLPDIMEDCPTVVEAEVE